MVLLTWGGVGSWGDIKHGFKQLQCAPLQADVQSHLSTPFTIQTVATLATGERKLTRALLLFSYNNTYNLHLTLIA